MGTSISFMPTMGFDVQMKNGHTSKVFTRSQCITTMVVYDNKSLEELRLEDYQLGRRGPKVGYGTSLYRFEAPWLSELGSGGDQTVRAGKLQSITGMEEFKNTSFEELRLVDYRNGRGPKFNQFTETGESIIGKVFQPNGQPPNETVYCNLLKNLNITLPSVNFLGAPSQQRQIINAKRQLQPNFKNIKTTNANNSTLRLPFKFKSGVFNKNLDTTMSTVAEISKVDNNNDPNINTADTTCNNDVGDSKDCKDEEKVINSLKSNNDSEIVMGNSNEIMLQDREDNLITDLEKLDSSSSRELQNYSNEVVFEYENNLESDIEKTTNNIVGVFSVDSRETCPDKLTSNTKIMNCSNNTANKDDCEDISENITVVSESSTSHDKMFKIIDKCPGNEPSHINQNYNVAGETKPKDSQVKESYDTNAEVPDCINIINTMDESQCEDNLQTAATVNVSAMKEKDNVNLNRKPIENHFTDLAINNNPGLAIHLDNENINEMACNDTYLGDDNDIEAIHSFNSKKISKTYEGDIQKSVIEEKPTSHNASEQEEQAQSQYLPENTERNNMTEDDCEMRSYELNNNYNNKIDKPNDVFRFDSVRKPRMIVKPSKLQNIIAFKTPTPNSVKSPIKSGILGKPKTIKIVTNTTKPPLNTKIEISPKSIFSGYPFMNPNLSNRFNFGKATDSDKEATLDSHLQNFSNNTPKPDPVITNNSVPTPTARYIRKFTPFSFQKPDTANSNVSSTKTAIVSAADVKSASMPFIRVSFAQKRTTPHPNIVHSLDGVTIALNDSKPNSSSISNTSSILSMSDTSSSTITNTSVASTVASIKFPNLTIKPATFKNTASTFGVDIINYGASTSKQCTAEESISSKGDIAPSFNDLSVSNDTDSGRLQLASNETAMPTAELAKRKLPTCMSVDELSTEEPNKANANQTFVNQSNDSQESNLHSNLLTEAKSETVSLVSEFKGSSVPSLFKGKGLLKKSPVIKSSVPSSINNLEFNKQSLDSLLISPQKEFSLESASDLKNANNPFYLGSNENSPIKPQFQLTNSKLVRPAFDFSQAATVSVKFSFDTTDLGADSNTSLSSPAVNMFESNSISNSSAFKTASPSLQTVFNPIDKSSSQTMSSVIHNIKILGDSITQTEASNSNHPSQSPNVSFRIPQSLHSPNVSFKIPQSSQSPNVSFQIPKSFPNNAFKTPKSTQSPIVSFQNPQSSQSPNVLFKTPKSTQSPNVSFQNPQSSQSPNVLFKTPQSSQSPNVSFKIPQSSQSPNVSFKTPQSTQSPKTSFQIPQSSQPSNVSFKIPQSTQSPNVSFKIPQSSQSPNIPFKIPQSSQCPHVSLQIPETLKSYNFPHETPQSSLPFMQLKNTTPVNTFSFLNEVYNSINENTSTPPSKKPFLKLLNTEYFYPLVLHREKHRYRNLVFNNGIVTNTCHHPRNLYFFSAIPVIVNQTFTVEVTELNNTTNNDVVIGFTAVDPCGLNVLDLPSDPMMLVDRLEYWVFETLKFQMNEKILFQLKGNGKVKFFNNFGSVTSFFVDTTITLWLFIYVKRGIKTFSLKTNEQTDLSVVMAMDEPINEMNLNQRNERARQYNETSYESHLADSGFWDSSEWRLYEHALRRHPPPIRARNVNSIITANTNLFRQSRAGVGTSQGDNLHPRLFNLAQDRLRLTRYEINNQPISDVINRNSNRTTPISNITDRDSDVNQSNPSPNVKQSSKSAVSKSKRQERDNECIICCDKGIDCVLYTCGHSCMCLECGISILRQGDSKCPICRKIICDVIKIYKS